MGASSARRRSASRSGSRSWSRRGVKPTGVSGLTVVKRPDAKRQVAFRGAPLYRFVQDTKPGQVKGNGFKDVGVWRPVTTGSTKAPAAPAPRPSYGY